MPRTNHRVPSIAATLLLLAMVSISGCSDSTSKNSGIVPASPANSPSSTPKLDNSPNSPANNQKNNQGNQAAVEAVKPPETTSRLNSNQTNNQTKSFSTPQIRVVPDEALSPQ